MSNKLITCAATAITFLSACQSTTTETGGATGTGGTTPETYGQATSQRSTTPVTFSLDPTKNPTELLMDAQAFLRTSISGLPSDFSNYKKSGVEEYALHSITPAGNGDLYVTRSANQIGRRTDATLPDEIYATFTGQYAGLWGSYDNPEATAHIFGNVTLEWYVDQGILNGLISDRVSSNGTENIEDITLQATLNAQGIFQGTTSGGALPTLNADNGVMSAIPLDIPIGETKSGEIVGEISFLSSVGTTFYSEFGGIVASRD